MNFSIPCRMTVVLCAVAVLVTSCIYEESDDEFYRTLWKTEETPFGVMTLDFLCDKQIAIKASDAIFDDYGTYFPKGTTASFQDLFIIVGEQSYILDEATRDGDLLYLSWHPANSRTISVTLMHRLSSYD